MEYPSEWEALFVEEEKKPYFKQLMDLLDKEYLEKKIYPKRKDIFRAYELVPISKVKVVILGQDPYIRENQADGLSFSVNANNKIPPSLKNIYKEMESDLNTQVKRNGDLTTLACQGVFLLNTILTVEEGKSHSHKGYGWEMFTDATLKLLNNQPRSIVFMLWGTNAQKKVNLITNPNHLILVAPHPSPLSANRGFFGSGHFSGANQFLIKVGRKPIDWTKA